MITIRLAEERDIDNIVKAENECFAMPWTEESIRHDILENPVANVIVAELDGEFAGYADLWIVSCEGQVSNIAVIQGKRRVGVGRALVSKLLEIAAKEGCEEVFLEVRPSNEAAISLYRELGFRELGERPGYYLDNGEAALIMALEI